jgi:membrane protein DedA with SNARE-associated domain
LRYSLAVFLAVLSTTFLPVPEEAVLLGAGYAARLTGEPLGAAALAACAAAWVGDCVGYGAGRMVLGYLARTAIGRHIVSDRHRAAGARLVRRYGDWAIVLARFLVGLRGAVYLAVGAARYPLRRFLAIDAVAAVVEVGALVGAGFAAGELRVRASSAALTVWVDGGMLVAVASAYLVSSIVRARMRNDRPT